MKGTEGTPYALEAEQAIVAALFGDRAVEMFDRLILVVKADEFYFQAHASVFQAFGKLVEEGSKPDPASLSSRIKSSFKVDDETRKVLVEAASYPYVPDNIETYGRLVAEKATGRRVAASLTAVAKKAGLVGGELSAADLLREVDSIAQNEMREAVENQLLQTVDVPLAKTLDWLERRGAGETTGLATGIKSLDEFLGGVSPTDMVVVAGRPSMGKTAMGLTLAVNAAQAETKPVVAIFSLEMDTEQLMLRNLSNLGSIDHTRLRRAALSDEDYDRLASAIGRLTEMNLRIDCDPYLSPAILRAKLRLLTSRIQQPLGMILVDYLQLMQPDRQLQNKATEVAEISRSLKLIAKEFKAPVFALSQLNRGVENRPNKRPTMADLRESGGIEQDADTIIMLYRDEYYNPDTDQKGITELIVPKNRNGSTGTVPAAFLGEYQRFADAPFSGYGGN